MVQFSGKFDGKVLIPDEPLNEAAGRRFRITLTPEEPVDGEAKADAPPSVPPGRVDLRPLIGIAKRPGQKPYHPDVEDAYWKTGELPSAYEEGVGK